MEQKLALVTGGAGFVGSHLCERLVKEHYRVISLDNYFTGSVDNHVSGVEYRRGHTKDIAQHIHEKPHIIFHLGEYARVEQSVLEPDVVYDLNTVGTAGVIDFWKLLNHSGTVCTLVYAGSSTKFGDDGKTRHTSPYAQTKADNSEKVRDVGEQEKLPYAVTYFYNVYGPRERAGIYGTVIEQFKKMYHSGAPCAIVSPGSQVRNFTHVSDIVDGLILVGEKGSGDEYGLGNAQTFSIIEVADMFGFEENRVVFPARSGNRMSSHLDTSKAKILGWFTKHTLPEYIQEIRSTIKKGAIRDKRVLVFSTTIHPIAGLAEDAFLELTKALPDVTFDVVTTKFNKSDMSHDFPENVFVYRVGIGSRMDKFLLPILGFFTARTLWKKHQYLFVWSLMASYAALSAVLFKQFIGAPVLVTLADQNLDDLSSMHHYALRVVFSRSDQIYGTHGAQESHAKNTTKHTLPRNSLGEGDSFANALRYAYADIVRHHQEKP